MTEEVDHLHTLRQNYKELQDSASTSLSKALDESSKVYQSVLVDSNDPSRKRTGQMKQPSVGKNFAARQPSIMDEFIAEPSVPLRTPAGDEFLDLISCLMEPGRPRSPEFGSTTYYARDN